MKVYSVVLTFLFVITSVILKAQTVYIQFGNHQWPIVPYNTVIKEVSNEPLKLLHFSDTAVKFIPLAVTIVDTVLELNPITLEEEEWVKRYDSIPYNLYGGKISASELNTAIMQMFSVSDKKIRPDHLHVEIFRGDKLIVEYWNFDERNRRIDIDKVESGDKVVLVFYVINQRDKYRLSQVGNVFFEVI